MPDIEIEIGGRPFTVTCQEGEEEFLFAAAAALDAEARPLIDAMGRLPEGRMLLMAGLMIADRAAGTREELMRLRARLAEIEATPPPAPERVEVPVIPPQITETLAEMAARAESLASRMEERMAG